MLFGNLLFFSFIKYIKKPLTATTKNPTFSSKEASYIFSQREKALPVILQDAKSLIWHGIAACYFMNTSHLEKDNRVSLSLTKPTNALNLKDLSCHVETLHSQGIC